MFLCTISYNVAVAPRAGAWIETYSFEEMVGMSFRIVSILVVLLTIYPINYRLLTVRVVNIQYNIIEEYRETE